MLLSMDLHLVFITETGGGGALHQPPWADSELKEGLEHGTKILNHCGKGRNHCHPQGISKDPLYLLEE